MTKKPQINYPCSWEYKIIGKEKKILEEAVAKAVGGRDYSISLSQKSRTGKYTSLNIQTNVSSEADRNRIFSSLNSHLGVSLVL